VGEGDGGNGGTGRIRIEYCNSFSGVTDPPTVPQMLTCYIIRQLPGSPNTELTLPEAITGSVRYRLQYGERGTFAGEDTQDYHLTLTKRIYDTVGLDALFENLITSTFTFDLDAGADGSVEWSGSGTEQPVILSSPELAAGLNAYLAATGDPWGADVVVPIRVSLDTSGDIFLTNFSAAPGGDSDPQVGAGDLTASDTTPMETDPVTLDATIHNLGYLPARDLVATFFAGDPQDGGVYLGSGYVASVPVGATQQTGIVWDTTGYSGSVDLYVVLDVAGQLPEIDEGNNSTSIPVNVQSRADLQVGSLTFDPPEGRDGQLVGITATISNTGQTDAAAQTVAFYDGNPETGGGLIGTASASVPAGGTAQAQVSWVAAGKGPHTIYAIADSQGQVNESEEDNNTGSEPLYVGISDQVYLDCGSDADPAYDPSAGYGYLTGEPLIWGGTPIETARWNPDGSAGVQYQFDYLLRSAVYHLDLTLYDGDGAGRVETVWVNGTDTGISVDLSDGLPHYVSLLLDPAFYQDHTVVVAVRGGDLAGSVASEVAVREIQYVYLDCGPDPEGDPAYTAGLGHGYLNGYGSDAWGTTPVETVRSISSAEVQYRFDGLNPGRDYQVNLTLYEEGGAGRQEVIKVDGAQVGGPYTLSSTPQYIVVPVPPDSYAGDGSIVVGIRRTNGNYPVVSEIALEQRTVPWQDPGDDDWSGPVIGTPAFASSVGTDQSLTVTAEISDATMGNHGVSEATLLYGYAAPYDQYQVAGFGPGGNGDGQWTFTVPPQGGANAGKALKFSLVARDDDDSPASTVNNNGGAYFAVSIMGAEQRIYLPLVVRNH